MEKVSSTTYNFRADSMSGRPGCPIGKEEEKEEVSPGEAIYCRACGGAVTARDQKIAVHGSHTHTFFNPAGVVFELGCFSAAPGCHSAGVASSEFTWFAGYVWRFTLCRQCNSHLGWVFEMADSSFWGLILANLKE